MRYYLLGGTRIYKGGDFFDVVILDTDNLKYRITTWKKAVKIFKRDYDDSLNLAIKRSDDFASYSYTYSDSPHQFFRRDNKTNFIFARTLALRNYKAAKLYNVAMVYFEDFSEDIQFYPNLVALSVITGVENLYDIIMYTLQRDFSTQLVTLEHDTWFAIDTQFLV